MSVNPRPSSPRTRHTTLDTFHACFLVGAAGFALVLAMVLVASAFVVGGC